LVDLQSAATEIRKITSLSIGNILPQLVQSVVLPEPRIKQEVYERDSLSYNEPGADEALEALKITFLVNTDLYAYDIRNLLDIWIALARAGRGNRYGGYAASNFYLLNSNYSAPCRFDIPISYLKGYTPSGPSVISSAAQLEVCSQYIARQCWCSGYKNSDVSYDKTDFAKVDATFWPEDLEHVNNLAFTGSLTA
jgi:hypothetical protein